MIPDRAQLDAIAAMSEGDLASTPYAVLLHALAVHRRSGTLEIERGRLEKEIVLEHGVPVDCRSNLLADTLSRFMIARGELTPAQEQEILQQSAREGIRAGEAMVRAGILGSAELFKLLQQNLAKKLLDGFTWRSGSFRFRDEEVATDSALKVNVPQLVVIGVGKFSSQDEVNAAIGPLVGSRLFLHPEPPFPLAEIRLQPQQRQIVELVAKGKRIDELAVECAVPFDDMMRLVYSLAVIGIIVPEGRLPKAAPAVPAPPATAPVAAPPAAAPVASGADLARRREALMEAYLRHRTQDALELLGLGEAASAVEIEDAFVAFLRRFGPWAHDDADLADLGDKSEELVLAAGRAFAELVDPEKRNALLVGRRGRREERRKRPRADRFAIKSELLDSEQQYKKGKALMDEGRYREALEQLQFAHDFEPQSSTYRAELAYCRYLSDPERRGEEMLKELREVVRIDPRSGLARYYAGTVASDIGEHDEAEKHLEMAAKLMPGDRRPLEAAKSLAEERKKKRRFFG